MNKATSSIFAPIGVCDNKEIYFQSQGGSKQMSSEVVPNNAKDSKSQEKAKQTKLIDSLRKIRILSTYLILYQIPRRYLIGELIRIRNSQNDLSQKHSKPIVKRSSKQC